MKTTENSFTTHSAAPVLFPPLLLVKSINLRDSSTGGTGSSLSFYIGQSRPSHSTRLPPVLSQQIKLLGFHQSFFYLAVPSLLPLHGPFSRSGSLVHCVLKQPGAHVQEKGPQSREAHL